MLIVFGHNKEKIMQWITDNWLIISLIIPIVILVIDKIVTMTKNKYDDAIWTGFKKILNIFIKPKK